MRADDMNKDGAQKSSASPLKEVRDKNEYITNMGRPDIARIKRDAEDCRGLEADRDIAIKRAESQRAAASSQSPGRPGSASPPKPLRSQSRRKRNATSTSKRPSTWRSTKRARKRRPTRPMEIETNVQQQQVILQAVRVQQAEREAQVKVQDMPKLRAANAN